MANPSQSATKEIIIFTKELCATDAKIKLTVPTGALQSFNIPNGKHFIYFEATDASGIRWTFRLSIRRNDSKGNLRPEISGDWLRFVREKRLRAGKDYRVVLGKNVDEATGDERFFIKAETKLFGAWWNLA